MIPRRAASQSHEDHQADMARWMGYLDTAALNRDHDPLHHALAGWLGIPSHAMRQAAGEALTSDEAMLASLEEEAVLHVQRWMNHAGGTVP